MHFVNIQGQCGSEVYAIRWFLTCRMEPHETPSGNTYAFVHYGWANPSLAQQRLYFLVLRFSEWLGLSLALDLKYLSKREKRGVDQDIALFGFLPNQPAMVDLTRLLIDQAQERA